MRMLSIKNGGLQSINSWGGVVTSGQKVRQERDINVVADASVTCCKIEKIQALRGRYFRFDLDFSVMNSWDIIYSVGEKYLETGQCHAWAGAQRDSETDAECIPPCLIK